MNKPFARALLACAASWLAACVADVPAAPDGDACGDACRSLADARPGILRDNLRTNLRRLMERDATIFGQQRFNLTGINPDGSQWIAGDDGVDASNVRDLAGDHPGVLGVDVWDLAIKPATWTPTPATHARAAREVFARGGVVTMEWHMRGCNADALDGAGFYAAGNEDCLCRLANDDDFARRWLDQDKLDRFADALEAHGLASVPIVFRPLHEMTGDWFWWGYAFWDCDARVPGATVTGAAAYQRVFRRIVSYLRDTRGLDNLLVAYAPDKLDRGVGADDEARYLAGYPGDDVVDVLGIDLYYLDGVDFEAQSLRYRGYLELVTRLARERDKIAALTETGNYRLAHESAPEQSQWFGQHLLPLMRGTPGIRLAFALTWENRRAAANNIYVPTREHPGADDFRRFAADPGVLLLGDVGDLYRADADDGPAPSCASCEADSDGDGVGVEGGAPCITPSQCFDPAPYPTCEGCDSDPDGDGWGWEDEASCVIAASCGEGTAAPTCQACDSDPDGDGWGWEHEASCVVPASCVSGYPACQRCDSDPDGDGWGWEDEASCVVPASCR